MRRAPRFVLFLGASALTRQEDDPRLANRLDERTREAVSSIIETARKNGVPTEPLINRALEGASKRAPGTVIVAVVKSWADDLRRARQALGPASPDADIIAGAYALRNGVKLQELERLRVAKTGVRYAVALDVLSYLVNRGVPPDTIAPLVVNLALASATDEQLVAFRQDVERDISGGVLASTAAAVRGQGLERQLAEASSNGGAPGSALPSVRGSTRAADPSVNPAVGPQQGNASVSGPSGEGARPAGPRGKPKKRP
jgi:hypothetical protein